MTAIDINWSPDTYEDRDPAPDSWELTGLDINEGAYSTEWMNYGPEDLEWYDDGEVDLDDHRHHPEAIDCDVDMQTYIMGELERTYDFEQFDISVDQVARLF